jgi:hypothetical protein
VAVHVESLAHIAYLVGETHLQCVPRVVGVLHHLRRLDVGAHQGRLEVGVETRQQLAAGFVEFADHRLGRVEVVVHRAAFAQELRVDAHAELRARLASRCGFERRDHHVAHGAGQHRAADHHRRRAVVAAHGFADLLGDPPYVLEVDVAVGAARRAHAHHDQIGTLHRVDGLDAGGEPARRHLLLDNLADVLLDDGRAAGVDQVHLARLRVDADHIVALLRQAARSHGADVPQTQDADPHDR